MSFGVRELAPALAEASLLALAGRRTLSHAYPGGGLSTALSPCHVKRQQAAAG